MHSPLNILDQIQIETPCAASWESMRGGKDIRFCEQCELHVHDLSAIDATDAVALLERSQDRICVRISRRRDGTVITKQSGGASFRWRIAAWAASLFTSLFAGGCMTMTGVVQTMPRKFLNQEHEAQSNEVISPEQANDEEH